MKSPNSTQLPQMLMMMSQCRATCKQHLSTLSDSQVPEEVNIAGGYGDTVIDPFGVEYNPCDLATGKTHNGLEKFLSMSVISRGQARIVPELTTVGFEKRKIPKDIYAAILTNRKKMLKNGQKWKIEYCSEGLQNCMKIYETKEAQECHQVASEVIWSISLSYGVRGKSFLFTGLLVSRA